MLSKEQFNYLVSENLESASITNLVFLGLSENNDAVGDILFDLDEDSDINKMAEKLIQQNSALKKERN